MLTGQQIKIEGSIEWNASNKQGKQFGKLVVLIVETEYEFTPLMGRPWLDIIFLRWREYFQINSVVQGRLTVKDIERRFQSVFDGDYSSAIKNQEASIVIERDTPPVFIGAYTVPYGRRLKVEKEIDRLDCRLLYGLPSIDQQICEDGCLSNSVDGRHLHRICRMHLFFKA